MKASDREEPLGSGDRQLRGRPAPLTVLAVASLGVLMAFVDATIVNIAFPDIARSFPTVEISSLSWVLNSYNIVFAAFLVAAGKLADLLGRRRVFLQGIIVFTVASGLCAVAPSVETLVAFRVLQALGAALLVPASLGLVLQAYPADRRAHAVALLSAVGALAAGLGPSLGGLLVSLDDWRLVFLVNLPVGVVAYILSRRHLVESREPGRRQVPDLPGALLFAVAIAALVLAVIQGEEWGWGSPAILGCFALAALLGVVFVRRCTWHRSPIVDLGLMRIRTFTVTNSMTIVAAAGFYGYTLVNVLFLVGVWHYSVLEAGLAITPGPFVAAAVAGPTSRLAQRLGHRPVLVAGGLIWGAAVFWFVQRVGLQPDFLGEWLPGMILLGIGAGALFPNLSGAAVASAPGEAFGTASGLNSVARQVGAALGVAAAVALIGTPDPADPAGVERAFDNAWGFSAICLWVSALGCLAVSASRDREGLVRSPALVDAAKAVLGEGRPEIEPAPAPVAPSSLPTLPAEEIRPETVADFLGRTPIFAGLPDETRSLVAERAEAVNAPTGQWLFHEGEEADRLFVVRTGRLEVIGQDGVLLRRLGRGAVLGELALLTSAPRSASVRAVRDTELISIGREHFEQLLTERPEISLALNASLARQLQDSAGQADKSRPRPGSIAILPLDRGVDLARFGRGLASALGAHGSVSNLDGRQADGQAAGPDSSSSGSVALYGPIFDAADRSSDFVLLVADPERPDWLDFCLRQSDLTLALRGGGDPIPGVADRTELEGCDLVTFKGGASGDRSGLPAALSPLATHVIRPETESSDLGRIARRLSGTSVGIVLSGGGARAFSQIGVLEELFAAGIPIDRVGGTGMGALIGGMLAMEMEPEDIAERCFEEWMRRSPLGDYTFPRNSLIRGRRLGAMLERTFGKALIEDQGLGYFSSATDLGSGEPVAIRTGLLREAVEPALSPPVLAPVAWRDGRPLADGTLVDGLPVEVMAELNEGPIIAVDATVGPGVAPRGQDEGPITIFEALSAALSAGSRRRAAQAGDRAWLTITPETGEIGIFEFHQLDRAREVGRTAARAALEQAASR